MAATITVKRGLAAGIPSLAVGEPAFTTDTHELYVGSSGGNVLIGPTSTGGTVTSVDVSGGTTGLTTSGGPITTTGTITLAGTLALANGGTGATDASGARAALGLGDCATLDVGTGSGEVAAGDHTHAGVYQPLDATLTALAGVTTAADKLIYATGSDTFSTTTITAFGRSLIDDADSTTARGTLGLGNSATLNTGTTAGTVATGDHTHSGVYQEYSPILQMFSDATPADRKIPRLKLRFDPYPVFVQDIEYFTLTDFSATLIDDTDATAARGTLGLGNSATLNTGTTAGTVATGDHTHSGVYQPLDATLTALAGVSTSANTLIYATGSDTFATSSLTAIGRSRVAYVQSAITADPTDPTTDTHYLCDPSSASFTVTLPAASTFGAGKRLLFTLTATSSNRTVTLDPNSTETILCRDGTPATVVLYVAGDVVEVESDGTNWVMVRDGRIPHKCQIVRSTAQSIANDTDTKVSMNTSVFDVGGLANIANSRVVIRRSGLYTVSAMWGTPAVMGAGSRSQVLAKINGTNAAQMMLYSGNAASYLIVETHQTISLASGDIVEMYIYQNSGAAQDTETSSLRRPCLTLTELL